MEGMHKKLCIECK